ncbi:kinase-like domain-containing protein [Lentinula raphanica]|uniref:Kinase-like domain-containing protein n=1 Tax=Lentinula raphanica TaxID=153919 RepID=A0AA38P9G9_9AGAR|nr:kinase-like domain-containing protein [Lentinula raphanica]KAJ3968797.1 kinase-like domain-containing protein [Lentinula raphanica]
MSDRPFRTGRVLGRGTFSIVKEIINIETGARYACKIVNKVDMEGCESMVLNEIRILKLISGGSKNIITLIDYFESPNNVFICVDLCTGGHLSARIQQIGYHPEQDAVRLVRSILTDIVYIHSVDVVHRDLKPENLLFRTPADDADLMITDFGLARVMSRGRLGEDASLIREVCGTIHYMAPEIFANTGYGKAVDIWAIGVITYIILSGDSPFARADREAEKRAIISRDFEFEPATHWARISEAAQYFINICLTMDPNERPTAQKCLDHPVSDQRLYIPL